jgi:Flp pilus assembly protein TadB
MKTMKAYVLGGAATFGLVLAIYAQTPGATPETPAPSPTLAATATATATPAISVSPVISATPSAANQFADKIKERVDRKFKHKGFAITVDGDDREKPGSHRHEDDDIPGKVLPIVIVSLLAVFGFPVAIVAVIMFSSWARTRSLHRTVRMMVEKGQPVPPELLASPAAAPVTVRPWYDLRRGIVLVSVGVGVIMFFGISAGWDNGVWALGLIPGLIGLGYLLAWRLAYRDQKALKQ